MVAAVEAAAAWAAASGVDKSWQAHQAAAAAGMDKAAYQAAAARAATHQFLDCLPERRVVWRLLFKGSLDAQPLRQQQQQRRRHEGAGTSAAAATAGAGAISSSTSSTILFHNPTIDTPASTAAGLGALVSFYAATAFSVRQQQPLAVDLTGQPAAAAASVVVAPPFNYLSLLVLEQSKALVRRQLLKRLEQRGAAYVRAVNNAAAAAAGGAEHVAAAAVQVAEYLQQQQQQQQQQEDIQQQQQQDEALQIAAAAAAAAGSEAPADASQPAAGAAASPKPRAAARHLPNVPLLLQQLPLEAVAAAAEAARARVDLARLHKDVHVAELGLELAQHSRQQVEEEADAAATGQLPQVSGTICFTNLQDDHCRHICFGCKHGTLVKGEEEADAAAAAAGQLPQVRESEETEFNNSIVMHEACKRAAAAASNLSGEKDVPCMRCTSGSSSAATPLGDIAICVRFNSAVHAPRCTQMQALKPSLLLLQVLALADKSQAELRRSIADLTKKCDDLLRHKRFLANQAAESSTFSAAAKRKSSRRSEPGADTGGEVHGAAGAGLGEVCSEGVKEENEGSGEDDLECAVCRSAMSEELQVRLLVTEVT
jgi:hypothetical protein